MTTHLMDDPRRPPATDGEIARRAYDRWVARCREADASLLDWLEAEAELRGRRETADRFAELDERLNSLLAARQEAEKRLATEHAVSGVLANSSALADAAPQIITAICECLGWDMGLLWRVDEQAGVLRCVEVCRGPTSTADDFERDTRGRSFPPGVGLPGQVWAAETLVWVSDVTAGTLFPRGPAAFRAGLRAAVGFPVRNGCEFLGVMEFFSREIQQPDDALIQMMNSIGRQISQFIERRQAEAEVCRQAEDRRLARCIQQGLLPKRPPVLPGFEIAGRSTAAEEVGGDCFDFLPMPAGGRPGLGVLVADASG
ncbi:MAG TPA: GAF domain-containing protein, partial [Planctomycetaceae bacterium]